MRSAAKSMPASPCVSVALPESSLSPSADRPTSATKRSIGAGADDAEGQRRAPGQIEQVGDEAVLRLLELQVEVEEARRVGIVGLDEEPTALRLGPLHRELGGKRPVGELAAARDGERRVLAGDRLVDGDDGHLELGEPHRDRQLGQREARGCRLQPAGGRGRRVMVIDRASRRSMSRRRDRSASRLQMRCAPSIVSQTPCRSATVICAMRTSDDSAPSIWPSRILRSGVEIVSST